MYTPPAHHAGPAPRGTAIGRLALVPLLLAGTLAATTVGAAPSHAQGMAARAADQPTGRAQRLTIHPTPPLAFEPNRGQAAAHADFVAHGDGYALDLTAQGAALTLSGLTARPSAPQANDIATPSHLAAPPLERATVQLSLVGGNAAATPASDELLPGTVGYALGTDRRAWQTGIPTYARVSYAGVYPGVDMTYRGNQGHLEYDFEVAPGADPRRIQVAIQGAGAPALDANGDLVLSTRLGEVRQTRPVAYQEIGGVRRPVDAAYTLTGNTVGFRLGAYDPRAALVIDPTLLYSIYYGGGGNDRGNGIAVDSLGDMYVVGTTTSVYPAQTAFISKFNAAGTQVLWTQYFSNYDPSNANNPNCDAQGNDVKVDSLGNVYMTGAYSYAGSYSWDSNLCDNQSVLWAKFGPSGNIIADNIYGQATGNVGEAIAVDSHGNSYITGQTDQGANNFPVTAGAFQTTPGIDKVYSGGVPGDAFVLKLDPSGNLIYGTFLGGSGVDDGHSIAVDASGDAIVGGTTTGTTNGASDFPVTANALQTQPANWAAPGFLSELNPSGSALLYSTFLSGNTGESVNAVGVDAQGDLYATGATDSSNFPTTANAYKRTCGDDGVCNPVNSCYYDWGTGEEYCHIYNAEDVFLSRFNPRLSGSASLLYSTYLGGGNRDMGFGLAVDGQGNAYITGRTASSDFPTVNASQATLGGDWDAFAARINTNLSGAASLVACTYLGGSAYDEGDAIAIDANGNAYVTGFTTSTNFPTVGPRTQNAGGADAFIAKLSGQAPVVPSALALTPAVVIGGQTTTGKITLSAPAPTGGATITLSSSSTVARVPASVVVPAGATSAGFTIATIAVAAASTATISGAYDGVSRGAALTVIPRTATTASLTAAPSPATYGQTVALTATVRAASGVPTGSVTFKDGATTLGAGTLNASGIATFSTRSLSVGAHSLTATYGGSGTYAPSVSPALGETVNKASPVVTLTSSANPARVHTAVTFTATVIGSGAIPTGSVTFRDGATALATVTLNASGSAAYSTSGLAAGAHTIYAIYGGNASYNTAQATLTQAIQ